MDKLKEQAAGILAGILDENIRQGKALDYIREKIELMQCTCCDQANPGECGRCQWLEELDRILKGKVEEPEPAQQKKPVPDEEKEFCPYCWETDKWETVEIRDGSGVLITTEKRCACGYYWDYIEGGETINDNS
jgi:hypothetical protein